MLCGIGYKVLFLLIPIKAAFAFRIKSLHLVAMETGEEESLAMDVDRADGVATLVTMNYEVTGGREEKLNVEEEGSQALVSSNAQGSSSQCREEDKEWQAWELPEGRCRKRVVQAGEGLYGPGLWAQCQMTVESCDPDLSGYPRGTGMVKLGEGTTPLLVLMERAVAVMKNGELAEVCIKMDRNNQKELVFHITLHSFVSDTPPWRMTLAKKCSAAREHKEKGTGYYKEGNIYAAFVHFRAASRLLLSIHPFSFADSGGEDAQQAFQQLLCQCHLNLAACQLKTARYDHVITNCTYVLNSDPSNVKALFRRSLANVSLGNYWLAQKDLQVGLNKEPHNRAMIELQQTVHEQITKLQTDLSSGLKQMFS